MIMLLDTETSGLPDFNKRASDPSQPHLVQMAAMLCEPTGEIRESHNVIIKPEGWEISDEVAAIHGIDHDLALRVGIREAHAAAILWDMLQRQTLLVAHNVQFDKFLGRIACRRHGLLADSKDDWWKAMPTFCTMKETMYICNLPSRRPGGPKWPKLEEAHEIIFGEKPAKSHDAMEDLLACKRLYFYLNPPTAKPAEQDEIPFAFKEAK